MESPTPEATTDEFCALATAAIDTLDASLVPGDVDFTLEQQVTKNDQLIGNYHLRIHDGVAKVVPGPADSPDVTLRQDEATARALQSGSMHAQGAFLTGRLSIDGDINKLLEYGPLLTQLLGATAGRS